MDLTKKQFDILEILTEESGPVTQRQLEERTGYSLGSINKIVKDLTEQNLVADGRITANGLKVLEKYRVKRAVFIAAGFGTRLVPLTFNTPKPLVRVHGQRIIDGLLDACLAAGIDEIYIVRGYLAEQFDQLLYKYPMLKFIENPAYNEANNISSALCARYLLQGAYVFEADLLIHNPKLVKKYQYQTNYLGFFKDRTDDWCFEVKDGIIIEHKVGGLNCYQEFGISYWSPADGARLAEDIEKAYEMPGGKELYWDQVATQIFKDHYKIALRECREEDIIEIDSYKELKAIDPTYNV
ncbi:MAG: NTP transferase domain-containing protein [Aeriscardovia sp.]|nr:NTP transferase domain-containing protein [Aeriscardovia sp.]MBR2755763.1 NTP transferase domain-containing protein [Lachnospiraceae bacterium]